MKDITFVAKKQRKLRLREARNTQAQYHELMEYTGDELNQILNEVRNDDYIPQIPMLM